jgi:Bacterial Ig-like domain (group 1)
MCNSLRSCVVLALLAALSSACGSNLILPSDDSPAALSRVSGDGQEGTVGSQLDEPLVVKVTDASSQPVEGVPVDFRFDSDVPDAVITPQVLTDSSGQAAAEVKLGTEAGPIIVLAQVSQASSSDLLATFGVTAVPGKGNKGKGGGRDRDDDDDDDDDEEEED